MYRSVIALLGLPRLLFAADTPTAEAAPAPHQCCELRTYQAAPGKLDALHSRFRDQALPLLAHHKATVAGCWVPVENPDGKVLFLLTWPDRAARDASWKALDGDPAWQAMQRDDDGAPLIAATTSQVLQRLDISPPPEADRPSGSKPRLFELRTYTTTPGNLPALVDRFRNHTIALFAKHGMTNLVYTTPAKSKDQAENTLIYFLAHESREARDRSFAAFRADPDWIAALTASEKKAGGPLTIPNGVRSDFLTPAAYSPKQ